MGYPSFSAGDTLAASDMNAVGLWKITSGITASTTGAGSAATVTNGTVTITGNAATLSVANAFTSDFDNYRIIYSGGSGSTAQAIAMTLTGSGTGNYYSGSIGTLYGSDTLIYLRDSNGNAWQYAGGSFPNGNGLDVVLYGPQKARRTGITISARNDYRTDGASTTGTGFHNLATAYTGFTLTVAGTMTGGNLRVYGFRD